MLSPFPSSSSHLSLSLPFGKPQAWDGGQRGRDPLCELATSRQQRAAETRAWNSGGDAGVATARFPSCRRSRPDELDVRRPRRPGQMDGWMDGVMAVAGDGWHSSLTPPPNLLLPPTSAPYHRLPFPPASDGLAAPTTGERGEAAPRRCLPKRMEYGGPSGDGQRGARQW